MKRLFYLVFICITLNSNGQKSTFDIFNFAAPEGWTKELSADNKILSFAKVDKKNKTWARINLAKATPSKGNIAADFNSEWENLVMQNYHATNKSEDTVHEANGWKIKAAGGKFIYNKKDAMVLMTTFSGHAVCASIVTTTNSASFLDAVQQFLESLDVNMPDTSAVNTTKAIVENKDISASTGNYAFSTTNFDDGWKSTEQKEYVLVQKGNINVFLLYVIPSNELDLNGTGREFRLECWNNIVTKYFKPLETRVVQGNSFTSDSKYYIEGKAIELATGQQKFIGMIAYFIPHKDLYSLVIASAPDEATFRKQFPNATMKDKNELLAMYYYNRFAVGKDDLRGHWEEGGDGTYTTWYSASSGQNVGSTAVATGADFYFNANGTYRSIHNGATGWVGSMNTYHQEYKGTYTVKNWSITMDHRWKDKTVDCEAWFEVIKGGRILHLTEGSLDMKLVKSK